MPTAGFGFDQQVSNFPIFHDYLARAQQRVMHQLVQATIREGMLKGGIEIGDGLLFPLWNSRVLLILGGVKEASLRRYARIGSIRVQYLGDGAPRPLKNAWELLAILEAEFAVDAGTRQAWKSFREEIEDAVPNNAMCLKYRDDWNADLAEEVKASGASGFWDWATSKAGLENLPLFFEQWGAVGHIYHPCSKTKLGLLPNEVLRYSPEFQGGASIRLAAVRRDFLHVQNGVESAENLTSCLETAFPAWVEAWRNRMAAEGLTAEDYSPIPVHPWQAEHAIPTRFARELEDGTIALLDGPVLETASTMSFRTMAPKADPRAPHIKLPVAIQATSAVRTVSPASVQTGPKISSVLGEILARDETIGTALRLLKEEVGAHFRPRTNKTEREDDMRFLSVLFRSNPLSRLAEGENAVAVASLFVKTPQGDATLLTDIMRSAGCVSLEDALGYFHRYADIVLRGHLDLYLKYGIALEAHQQNTLAVFGADHRPIAMMARDFGGIRIHRPTLASRGYDIEGYPGAVTVTDDRDEVRNKFLHAVMQGHLGEIVPTLAEAFAAEETPFWGIVADLAQRRFSALQSELDPALLEQEADKILRRDWNLKALTRMRLEETSHHYIYVSLDNPLREHLHD